MYEERENQLLVFLQQGKEEGDAEIEATARVMRRKHLWIALTKSLYS